MPLHIFTEIEPKLLHRVLVLCRFKLQRCVYFTSTVYRFCIGLRLKHSELCGLG